MTAFAAERREGLVASVVVPVRDGRVQLEELLAALGRQTVPRERFEVVVGDDGSADGVAEWLAGQGELVRVTSGPLLNAYAARNRAVALARAPALVFCDADCRPEPTWLEAGLRTLGQADLVGGLIRFAVPERRTAWTLLDIELHLDQERAVRAGNGVTANLFVRREAFDRVGGFDPSLPSHGDYDFVQRCRAGGARLAFAPEAVVWHPTRDRARPFLRKVWEIHWSFAVREKRAGRRPRLLTKSYLPVLGMARSRRRVGLPFRLDRRRLSANGVAPRLRDDLRALPILYLVLPYVAGAARLSARLSSGRPR